MSAGSLRAALAAFALAAASASAWALDVGEKAPEFDVTGWAQGGPWKLADAAGRNSVIVCFWATFEPDCVEALPEMGKLLDKHKARGLDIVLVSTEPLDEVRKFLAERNCGLRAAIDQYHNTQAAWAKDVRKLPFAYLVDKTGTVVWKGDPTRGLDGVVEQVLAGKFDVKKAQELEQRHREVEQAWSTGDFDAVAKACDKVLEADPTDDFAFSWRMFAFQMRDDAEGFRKFARSLADRAKDDASTQRRIASQILGQGIAWREVDVAYACAKRAVELTKGADADALATYGSVLCALGLLEQAIEQQKKAVAANDKDEDLKKTLAYYESVLAVRKKAAAPAPPAPTPPKKK